VKFASTGSNFDLGYHTIKRDLVDDWAKETGLRYRHLSLICAMSIRENHQGMSRYLVGAGQAS
jgi:hypothetical protein